MIDIPKKYLIRLYEVFGDWSKVSNKNENSTLESYKSLHTRTEDAYNYIRDVVVTVGAYLPRFVLGMTDRVKIWLRYGNDEDTLDHELWHMEGKDEYETRSLMNAGLRPNRRKWRIIREFA